MGKWLNYPHYHYKWFYNKEKEEVIFINNKNVFTIFTLDKKEVTCTEEKRFLFYKQVSEYYKPDTEVQVQWDGLNPNLIRVQEHKFEALIKERGKFVENDRFIKIKNTEHKYEFNQAARKGNIRAVADASFH